jgi:hypothetical protein
MNHTQEECRKCIKENKPCVNNKGQFYWPKINSIKVAIKEETLPAVASTMITAKY